MGIVEKGWGREIIYASQEEKNYTGKILEFDRPGACTSLHFHLLKHETFYVLNGTFVIELVNQVDCRLVAMELEQTKSVIIPPGAIHRIIAKDSPTWPAKLLEAGTFDRPSDTIRVSPGDSQKVEDAKPN